MSGVIRKHRFIYRSKKTKEETAVIKPPATNLSQAASGLTVTEQVIEYESKKRKEKSSHPDNISATEYFTKGKSQSAHEFISLFLILISVSQKACCKRIFLQNR